MTGILITLIAVLVLVVLVQVTKTLDLVSELRSDTREEERHADIHGRLLMLFLILGLFGFFWCFGAFQNQLFPDSASAHGALLDNLFMWTLIITGAVFLVTNVILFWFAYKYRWRNNRRAEHIAHNNTLEMIWTAVPAVVLTFLVVKGLVAWDEITGEASEDALIFEMTGQQFFWTSRYPGADGALGLRDYNLIDPNNALGLVTPEWIDHKRAKLLDNLVALREREEGLPAIIAEKKDFIDHHPNPRPVDSAQQELNSLERELAELPAVQARRRATYRRIVNRYTPEYLADPGVAPLVEASYDDFLPSELHLPVERQAEVRITALDVLHNFYIPYMSVKMDAVPGIPTRFKFTPITTTEEMREKLRDNPVWQVVDEGSQDRRWKNFLYEIACAELCGKGHNSMRYTLDVDTDEDYNAWLSQQTPYFDQVEDMLATKSPAEFGRLEEEYVHVDEGHGHDGGHDDHQDDDGHAMLDGGSIPSR